MTSWPIIVNLLEMHCTINMFLNFDLHKIIQKNVLIEYLMCSKLIYTHIFSIRNYIHTCACAAIYRQIWQFCSCSHHCSFQKRRLFTVLLLSQLSGENDLLLKMFRYRGWHDINLVTKQKPCSSCRNTPEVTSQPPLLQP